MPQEFDVDAWIVGAAPQESEEFDVDSWIGQQPTPEPEPESELGPIGRFTGGFTGRLGDIGSGLMEFGRSTLTGLEDVNPLLRGPAWASNILSGIAGADVAAREELPERGELFGQDVPNIPRFIPGMGLATQAAESFIEPARRMFETGEIAEPLGELAAEAGLAALPFAGRMGKLIPKDIPKPMSRVSVPPGVRVTEVGGRTVPPDITISKLRADVPAFAEKSRIYKTPIKGKPGQFRTTVKQQPMRIKAPQFDTKRAFSDFIGEREDLALARAETTRRAFTAMDDLGPAPQVISRLQKGLDVPGADNLRRYFDSKFKEAKELNMDVGYLDNYFPQLWKNSREEVQAAVSRMQKTPGFSRKRIFENIEEGIAAGLTPRFEKVSDFIAQYEHMFQRAAADRKFMQGLRAQGLLSGKQKPGMIEVPGVPSRTFVKELESGKKAVARAGWYAEPETANLLNSYFEGAPRGVISRGLEFLADMNQLGKKLVLTGGIPKTGFNYFGMGSQLPKQVFALGLQRSPERLFRGITDLATPSTASKRFDNLYSNRLEEMAKDGVTFTSEDIGFFRTLSQESTAPALKRLEKRMPKTAKASEWLVDQYAKYFENPLFQKVLPAWKADIWSMKKQELQAMGWPAEEAGRAAAELANKTLGGLKPARLGRSRDMQNLLRTVFLAPDFYESTLGLGKGVAKSIFRPGSREAQIYGGHAQGLLASYIGSNVMNMIATGKPMSENPEGRRMEVHLGKDPETGKSVYVPVFKGYDVVTSIPQKIAEKAAQGDLGGTLDEARRALQYRFAPFTSTMWSFLTGRNWAGRNIYRGPTGEVAANIWDVMRDSLLASQPMQSAYEYLTQENVSVPETVLEGMEVPIRFVGQPGGEETPLIRFGPSAEQP